MAASCNAALQPLLNRADIWRGSSGAPASSIATGFAPLDSRLPGGGWPGEALTELITDHGGELNLLMPALARLSRRGRHGRRRLALIAPPHIPYAPALLGRGMDLAQLLVLKPRGDDDIAWALEQTLRSGAFAAAMAWLPSTPPNHLRRLQIAAESGACWAIVQRPVAAAGRASPAALRLRVEPREHGLKLDILKCRGRPGHGGEVWLPPAGVDASTDRDPPAARLVRTC